MTPKPEHVEKAREIVSAWIEAHWPVDDPTPKDRSELDLVDRIALALSDAVKVPEVARPLSEYHEDFGDVLWWSFPVNEPPYVGTNNDSGFPSYVTHWTPLPPLPSLPETHRSVVKPNLTSESALSSLPAARKDQA